jgi:protoporphyrinogen oxidase
VGAGMAGISTAKRLEETASLNGIDVDITILEAQDRPGRSSTANFINLFISMHRVFQKNDARFSCLMQAAAFVVTPSFRI